MIGTAGLLWVALAGTGGASIEWDAPPGCPQAPEIEDAARMLAGEALGAAEVTVRGRVWPDANRYRLALTLVEGGRSTRRELADESCEVLSEAGTLLVAMALNPALDISGADLALLTDVDAPTQGAEVDTDAATLDDTGVEDPADDAGAPEVERMAPAPTEPPVAHHKRPQAAARVGAGVGRGALPRTDGSLVAAGVLLLPGARFELGAGYWFTQDKQLEGVETRFTAWSISARGGPRWVLGRLSIPLLLGSEVGQVLGRADGLDNAQVARAPWVAITADAGVFFAPVPALAVGVVAEGFVAATRPEFRVGGVDGFVHRPSAGGGRGYFTLEVRFP